MKNKSKNTTFSRKLIKKISFEKFNCTSSYSYKSCCFYATVALYTIVLAACSEPTGPMPIRTIETSELQIEATEIFMSRSNLTTTEFEHYKLSNNNLFVECGKLNRGRYFPEQQNVFEVDSSNTKKILDLDRDFITEKVTNHLNLDKPGDNNNLFDPGIFNISISTNKENFDTSTSLDTISIPTAKAPKILKKIAAGLRQLSTDKPCGNLDFYGIQ